MILNYEYNIENSLDVLSSFYYEECNDQTYTFSQKRGNRKTRKLLSKLLMYRTMQHKKLKNNKNSYSIKEKQVGGGRNGDTINNSYMVKEEDYMKPSHGKRKRVPISILPKKKRMKLNTDNKFKAIPTLSSAGSPADTIQNIRDIVRHREEQNKSYDKNKRKRNETITTPIIANKKKKETIDDDIAEEIGDNIILKLFGHYKFNRKIEQLRESNDKEEESKIISELKHLMEEEIPSETEIIELIKKYSIRAGDQKVYRSFIYLIITNIFIYFYSKFLHVLSVVRDHSFENMIK